MKPCQRPNQKPAIAPWSLAVALDWLGLGAQPAKMLSSSKTTTSNARLDIIEAPLKQATHVEHRKSQDGHHAWVQNYVQTGSGVPEIGQKSRTALPI